MNLLYANLLAYCQMISFIFFQIFQKNSLYASTLCIAYKRTVISLILGIITAKQMRNAILLRTTNHYEFVSR